LSELFLTVLNMSLTASFVIAAIMLARILLKRAPKAISYVLWVVAGFRLVFPFSFESVFSLIPFKTQLIPQTAALSENVSFSSAAGAAYHAIGDAANGGLGTVTVYLGKSSDGYPIVTEAYHSQVWLTFGSYLWIIGIAILLIYSFVSIILLKHRLSGAVILQDNIYRAENLKTPFVLGYIRPKIYIPSDLSEEEKSYIILHEQVHIKRLDHIAKLIAFLILCVHWFNPLVWVAFILMSTDMEMSCDEKVLKAMNEDVKKPYANTLLSLAAGRHILNGSPLAFGEGNVKGRIKNVLNYKRPRFWIVLCSIIIVAAIGIGLAANPKSASAFNGFSYRVKEILYEETMYSFTYTLDNAPQYSISSDYKLYSKENNYEDWVMHGRLYSCEISRQELLALFLSPSDNVREAINKTKLIYRADKDDEEIKTFYLVMQLEDGNVLFALGYDNGENRYIRWLFRLEKTGDFNGEASDINLTDIRWDVAADVPQPVRDYAVDYVREQIEYYNSLGYNITDAKITAMTFMNTGTASLTNSIEMWLLEYRLWPEDADKVVLAGGMRIEDGWLTEWGSTGQPYLLLLCDLTGSEKSWQRICVTNTDVITQDYGTPEMIEQYGNEFTAAAMELYKKNLEIRTIGQVPAIYILKEELGHRAVQKVAELLMTELLNDLKTEQVWRTFTITDWKNLSVSADRMYDAWVVTGEVEVRYKGFLSPIGDSDTVPRGEYVKISIGERYLRHKDGVFTLSLVAGEQRAILEPPFLTPDMSIGIGVFPDYDDDELLVFHGYFGLFVYDLKAGKITFAADLGKAVGTTVIQGSEGAAVRVSDDGNTIQLCYYPEQGIPKMAYTIDTRTGSYTYDNYVPISPYFSPPDEMYDRFSGATLGELTYTDGKKSWLIFADWHWAN
jgi:beta-lactamase regulating signal transducer with metallopeptidase domain